MSQLFAWGGQSTGVSALASFLPKNTRADLLQNGLVGSPRTPRDSQESSPTPQLKKVGKLWCKNLVSSTLVKKLLLKNLLFQCFKIMCYGRDADDYNQFLVKKKKHQFFSAQPSSRSNSHIHTWPLEKPQPWLDRPLLAKQRLCFWTCYWGWA